jgi:hypothetical protein
VRRVQTHLLPHDNLLLPFSFLRNRKKKDFEDDDREESEKDDDRNQVFRQKIRIITKEKEKMKKKRCLEKERNDEDYNPSS